MLKERLPTLDIDPFSDEFLTDPYASHEALREAGPVVWLEPYRIFASARYADVQAALQDWRNFSSAAGVGLADVRKEEVFRPRSILLEADPPYHDHTRQALAQALTPAVLRGLRPAFEAEAERLVDALVRQRTFDGVAELAEIYPIRVFADAMGICEEGRENLLPYAAAVFNDFGPRNQLYETTRKGADAVRAWVIGQCHRDRLAPGGIGARVFEAVDRGEATEEEAHKLVRSLLTAGLDTTVYGLGNALACFAAHPAAWARLREHPGLARGAFEEVLRYESVVQTFFRTTSCETELGGVTLPADAKILLFLGAANRDPRRWEAPETFDIERKASGHVGFGYGVHACVGQMVARLEGEIVLAALARRVERLELAGAPVRKLNNTLRGLASLPLRIA